MNTFDVLRTLWDYYSWSTVLLTATLVGFLLIGQPARRMAIAWATTGGLVVLFVLTAVPNWSRYSLSPPAPLSVPDVERSEPAAIEAAMPVTKPLRIDAPQIALEPSPQTAVVIEIDWELTMLALLGLGSLAVACWLALGGWQARRLRNRATAAPRDVVEIFSQLARDGHRQIEVGVHRELPVAVALGLRRPCILLPQALVDQASAGQLRSVLAHELAHVEHGDLWLLAVLRVLTVVLWPHPVFWLLRRQVRHDQEVLADTAAAALTTRTDYAEQLVALARAAIETRIPRLASSVGLWEKRTQLTERIKLLLDERLTVLRVCSRRWRISSAGMLAALALGLSLVTLSPRIAQSRAESETTANDEAATVSPAEFAKLLQEAETRAGFGNAVGDLVVAAIQPSQLPFLNDKRLAIIRGNFVNFVTEYMPADITAKRKADLLMGLRDHAQRHLQLPDKPITDNSYLNNVYLNFKDRIKTLQWKLWMAFTLEPLDAKALAKRESQRNWMRKTIADQPAHGHYTHEQVANDLEATFADPLSVIFDRPMSDYAFAKFQSEINNWLAGVPGPVLTQTKAGAVRAASASHLPYMVHRIVWNAVRANWEGENSAHKYRFPVFDGDEIHGYVSGGYLGLHFVSNKPSFGPYTLHLDGNEPGGAVDADTGMFAHPSLDGKGDFAFKPNSSRLVAENGAKLLLLEVANWVEADAVPTEELKRKLQDAGQDHVSLPARPARRRDQFIKDYQQGRVDWPYNEAGNVEEALTMWESIGSGEGPYVGILTKEGNVAVVQVQYTSGDPKAENIQVRVRVRPVATTVSLTPVDTATVQLAATSPPAVTAISQVANESETGDSNKLDLQNSIAALGSDLEPNTVIGICLDEQNRPLAEVEVTVFEAEGAPHQPATIASTKSGADGKFRFENVVDVEREFPDGLPDENFIPPGSPVYNVVARAPGRVPGIGNELAFQIARRGTMKPFSMSPAQSLKGRIVDQDGRPIAGARVSTGMWGEVIGIPEGVNSAMTDADGRFEIVDLEAYNAEQLRKEFEARQQDYLSIVTFAGTGQLWERFVTVEHPDYARKRQKISSIPGSVDVTLSPGAVLTGKVVTQDDGEESKPAPAAEVMAMLLPSAGPTDRLIHLGLIAKTDEAGNYRFGSLPGGVYRVQANHSGWVTNGLEELKVASGETVSVPDLVMTRGGRVRIQLVDDATGKPLDFAEPTKAYVSPVHRPIMKNAFGTRPNIVEFTRNGIGETQVPAGNYLFNVVIPSKEGVTGWMRADFNSNLSTEQIESVPGQKINEGDSVEIEVRMVHREIPTRATATVVPAEN